MPLMHVCTKCHNPFRPLTKFYAVCYDCSPDPVKKRANKLILQRKLSKVAVNIK